MFQKATKKKSKLRLAIEGASGSGKTYSSLILAKSLGDKVAVLDSEHGSASLYSDKFGFDVLEIKPPYNPERFIKVIEMAEEAGYDVLVIDSLTHEWNGEGGCLDLASKLGGSFGAWDKVTPRHNKLINKMLNSTIHIIVTMRSKANYETGKDNNGKMTVEKKGTAPIQREGLDYEFTVVFDLNKNHFAQATKDRTGLFDGLDFIVTDDVGKKLICWLNDGGEPEKEVIEDKPIIKVTEKEIEKKVVEAEFFPKTEKTTEIEVKVINTPEPEPEKDAFDEIKEKVLTKSVMIDEIKRISSLLKLTDTLLYDNDIYVDKWLKPAITNLYNELVKMENEELQKSRTISTEQLLDIKHLREEQNIEPGDFLEEWSKKLGNNLTSKSFLQISQFEANKIIDDMIFNPKK